MPLSPGDRLGPYEIVSPLGKGGMGEVWRARDPRLNRDVAIKISAQQFTDRFEREAHAIAALNHPNICTLYDVGPNYLVMELVEGPTLAERIAQGPIPLDEALRIAKQIADALEAAHEKSIVHRDLKPANIKIKPDGSVKVLDFGLAKTGEVEALSSDSPTLLTVHGMILGTAGYMAPEQAAGRPVDKRADIWAFGVVLYEMLTGQRLFQGDSVAHILADVLRGPIDLDKLPKETPRRIRHLMKRCLDRDLRTRLRDIREARVAIEGVDEEPEQSPAPARSRLGESVPWAVAAVLFLAAVGLGFVAWRHYSEEPQLMRMSLQIPEKAQFAGASIPMISPDGRHVAFAARVDGKTGLWLRDLDALSARQLPGTDGASYPFWSPDSRWIAFFAGGKLKKIDVTGGPALTLCDFSPGRPGTWNRDDVIVFGTVGSNLFRVPAAGGTPAAVDELDSSASEANHHTPWFLPDGRHFLYTARSKDAQKSRIYVESVDAKPGSKTRREILAADSNAVYVPRAGGNKGYLLFVRETTLMAQPFDPRMPRPPETQ